MSIIGTKNYTFVFKNREIIANIATKYVEICKSWTVFNFIF